MKLKVFICLPMKGRNDKEIQRNIKRYERIFTQILKADGYHEKNIKFIHNFIKYPKHNLSENNFRLMCCSMGLLTKMIPADIICFGEDWSKSRGCLVEAVAATVYHKNIYAIQDIGEDGTINVIRDIVFRYTLMDSIADFLKGGDIK
jgi:hypothetical protein